MSLRCIFTNWTHLFFAETLPVNFLSWWRAAVSLRAQIQQAITEGRAASSPTAAFPRVTCVSATESTTRTKCKGQLACTRENTYVYHQVAEVGIGQSKKGKPKSRQCLPKLSNHSYQYSTYGTVVLPFCMITFCLQGLFKMCICCLSLICFLSLAWYLTSVKHEPYKV